MHVAPKCHASIPTLTRSYQHTMLLNNMGHAFVLCNRFRKQRCSSTALWEPVWPTSGLHKTSTENLPFLETRNRSTTSIRALV